MVTTLILNGITGWAMVIVLLFAIADPESVLVSSVNFCMRNRAEATRTHGPVSLFYKSSSTQPVSGAQMR